MTISVASDHGGYERKTQIVEYLRKMSPLWDELEKGEKKHVI